MMPMAFWTIKDLLGEGLGFSVDGFGSHDGRPRAVWGRV